MGNEVAGEWRNMHNEELHNLYSSSNVIRMVSSTHGERTNAFSLSV
jgi:hypothetical protein